MMKYFPKTNNTTVYQEDKSLTDLANFYETDKGDADKFSLSWGKDYPEHFCMAYTKTYEKYMVNHRDSPETKRIFEVGIKDKRFPFASCKMWLSYFKNLDLYAMDNFWGCNLEEETAQIKSLTDLGVNFIYGDQGNFIDWKEIQNLLKDTQIDFFIEDGSHWPNHMVVTLWKSIDMMHSGSYYFMEDIQNPVTSRGKFRYDNSLLADELLMSLHTNKISTCFLNDQQNEEVNNAFELVELVLDPHAINYLAVFKRK